MLIFSVGFSTKFLKVIPFALTTPNEFVFSICFTTTVANALF